MFDRFLVPYYFCFPIIFLSFIFVFFLPTSTDVAMKANKNGQLHFIINDINIMLNERDPMNVTEECQNFIDTLDNNKNLQSIKKFSWAVKITVFILLGLACLNFAAFLFVCQSGFCLDENEDDRFSSVYPAFSCNFSYDKISYAFASIVFAFTIICLGVVFLSILIICRMSIFKSQFRDYCQFELNRDYEIKYWKRAAGFAYTIIVLFGLEIFFGMYSLIYGIYCNLICQ